MKAKIKLNTIEVVKLAIRIGASVSVGSVVGGIISTSMPYYSFGWRRKLMRKVGTFVIVGMAEDRADKYVEETLDKVFNLIMPKAEMAKNEEPKVEEVSKEPEVQS